MINPYDYLFYRIFKRHHTTYSKHESAFAATVIISCLIYVNFVSICLTTNKVLSPLIILNNISNLLSGFSILLLNIFYFFYKKRYLTIEEIFSSFTKKQNGIGLVLIYTYVTLTIAFFVYATSL
jgi:hypothetical protein